MYTNLLFGRTPLRRIIRRPVVRRPVLRRPVINQFGGNGADIFYNNGGVGPPGPPGPPGNPSPVAVTTVVTTPYIVLFTDYMLAVDVEGPATIVLPIAPVGTVFIVKDIDGDAATNLITISGLGSTIDGSPTATIDSNYGSITLIFNGTEWNIV